MLIEKIQYYIETIILASEQSVSADDIIKTLEAITEQPLNIDCFNQYLRNITQKYNENEDSILELKNIGNGYQFLTKSAYYSVINQLQLQRSKKKLSQSALETLAIIAYRQPLTKLEMEQIRGVNCDYAVQKLLEKDLISIVGKSEAVGHPILYGTSNLFSDYFGINSIGDLPQLKDIEQEGNVIGTQQE